MNKYDLMFGICLRLQVYQQLREELAKVKTLEGIVDVNRELKLRCQVPRWFLLPELHCLRLVGACHVSHAVDVC